MKVLRTFSLDDILILPGGADWSSGSLYIGFNTYMYIINNQYIYLATAKSEAPIDKFIT